MPTAHQSKLPYLPEHPEALAVYCSDGRFTGAVGELCAELGFDRLDTLTIPGGPGLFEMASSPLTAVDTVRKAASFLIEAHHIKHVTLLSHQGCGYYRSQFFHENDDERFARQLSDLRSSASWLRASHRGVEVVAYHARPFEGRVRFDPVDC